MPWHFRLVERQRGYIFLDSTNTRTAAQLGAPAAEKRATTSLEQKHCLPACLHHSPHAVRRSDPRTAAPARLSMHEPGFSFPFSRDTRSTDNVCKHILGRGTGKSLVRPACHNPDRAVSPDKIR